MNWLLDLFGLNRRELAAPTLPERTDAQLEQFIDAAGREAVFDRARSLGWTVDNPPPKWVWGQIAEEVMRYQWRSELGTSRTQSQRMH